MAKSQLDSGQVDLTRTINTVSGTTYTFALSDSVSSGGNPIVLFSNSGAITATISSATGFPIGAQIELIQMGTGTVQLSASGVNLLRLNNTSPLNTGGQYVGLTAIQTSANNWVVMGYIT